MLRVTLTLVPRGDESSARVIGVMELANVGASAGVGRPLTHHYAVYVAQDKTEVPLATLGAVNHERTLGAWALVRKAIGSMRKR